MESENDMDRLLFFEQIRRTSETAYNLNPLDADNLTKWGCALLELSQFQNVAESKNTLQDSVAKLEEALTIDPKKHDALWCLGNAHTATAFMTPDKDEAKVYFEKASRSFQKAVLEDPENTLYIKSLEVAAKAPELHAQIHRQGFDQQAMSTGPPPTATSAKTPKKKKNNDLMYDILGWVILGVGIVAWIGSAKSHAQPPPLR